MNKLPTETLAVIYGSELDRMPNERDLILMRIGYKFNKLTENEQNKVLKIINVLEEFK